MAVFPDNLAPLRFGLRSDIRLDCCTQQLRYEVWSKTQRRDSRTGGRSSGSDEEKEDEHRCGLM